MKEARPDISPVADQATADESSEDVYVFPPSFAQQRLWFLQQMSPSSVAYNMPFNSRLSGKLDTDAFRRAFGEVVRRHEILRTSFEVMNGQPVQIISDLASPSLPVLDLSILPADEREREVVRLATEDAQRPFDLSHAPLFRARLVRLEQDEHVLLLTMHHIICDGWSVSIFVGELGTLYAAFVEARPSPLPDLPIQYADFAQWQRELLQGAALQAHLDYWARQLAGTPSVLTLPTDRPRTRMQTFEGERLTFMLSRQLSDALTDLSRQHGATLFILLLAAFQTLLHRYTGESEIVVGTPVANRNRKEIENLIGFFINMLVLRASLSGVLPFHDLLRQAREVCLDAYAHQDVPFERLVEEFRPERNLSYTPLFQVMFVLQNAPVSTVEVSGLRLTPFDIETVAVRFDLTLSVEEMGQGLECSFEYRTDLFDALTIERMSLHFKNILEGIVADPSRRLSELPLLTTPEKRQIVVEWNSTAVAYPQDECVHRLFEAQVERTPHAVAVVFGEQRVTYGELNRRADKLARYLHARGVGAETLVGILMERSIDMVVGLLGILKAGGAYLPLDSQYPKERLAFMLSDAQAPVVLTSQSLRDSLPPHNASTLCLDSDWHLVEQETGDTIRCEVSPANIAYVIYTSGSTGTAKGVSVEHRQLLNYIFAARDSLGLAHGASYAWVQPLTFDSCITAIYPSLVAGGCLHVVSPELALNARELGDYFVRHQIDCLKIAPSHMAALQAATTRPEHLVPRRYLVLGGEPPHWSLVRELQSAPSACAIFNEYGPTETTVGVTSYRADNGLPTFDAATVPIGRPYANVQTYVLDSLLEPVPVGISGELYIGGACLARGYFRRAGLTAERFIPNPFSPHPGTRLYKTGDMVRHLPDGNIEFLGRLDHQVKLRGFRIELGEIEAALGAHVAVREAVVVARGENGNQRLVAYVVAERGHILSHVELRDFLKKKLPDYMLPSAFVMLDEMPLTPHGKVARKALPAPVDAQSRMTTDFRAPTTPVEESLAIIWREVLRVERVSITDNFFDAGGHSLLATQFVVRVCETFDVDIPVRVLFEAPTLETLAAHVTSCIEQAQGIKLPHVHVSQDLLVEASQTQPRGEPVSEAWTPLVSLQPEGTRRPFFCVHPAGGSVFSYIPLTFHLGREQPFYALEARGIDGKQEPHTCVEAMAADYVAALQRVQAVGPYLLGGWSVGGTIAFEMARQLLAKGDGVASLVLLDAVAPASERIPFGEDDDTTLLANFAWHYHLSLDTRSPSTDDFSRLANSNQLGLLLEQAKLNKVMPPDFDLTHFRQLLHVYKSNVRAMRNYVPVVVPVPLLILRAEHDEMETSADPTLGWSGLSTQVIEVYQVPGDHFTLLQEPNVAVVAARLSANFARAVGQ